MRFNLITPGASSVNDVILVTAGNGLTLNGGAIQIAHNTTGAASLGYYKIIAYSGGIAGAGASSPDFHGPPIA